MAAKTPVRGQSPKKRKTMRSRRRRKGGGVICKLQLLSSRLVDMADDPADNAVFYNCVPTCNHLDSEPNTFRNKFFP